MKRNSRVHSWLLLGRVFGRSSSSGSKSKARLNSLLPRVLLSAILLVVLWSLLVSAHYGSAQRQLVPVITLQSSERILEGVPFISALAPTMSVNGKQLYALRRDTSNITTYDVERKRSKDVPTFVRATKALAIGTQGSIYLAGESEVRAITSTGESLGSFPIPNPTSLAVSANGDVAVNSTDSGKLLHVYDQAGTRLRSFGELKQFDSNNPTENAFLNRGKVLVGPTGAFYYVSIFAPVPTVQKFSSEGKLLLEFAIEGNAVDLQLKHAKDFLRSKKAEIVGGFHIITSAAIDPVTGHLWIGLNGSSTYGRVSSASGVAYEYDANGVKLAEYAFYLNPPLTRTGVIVDLSDISVSAPWIYVLTSLGEVYRFNINDKLVRHSPQQRKESSGIPNSAVRGWVSTVAPTSATVPQQGSCPGRAAVHFRSKLPGGERSCNSGLRSRNQKTARYRRSHHQQ